jgi:hypothetical protein
LSCARRKGDRKKLEGKIHRGQPRQIEAQPTRRKKPKRTFPSSSVKKKYHSPKARANAIRMLKPLTDE